MDVRKASLGERILVNFPPHQNHLEAISRSHDGLCLFGPRSLYKSHQSRNSCWSCWPGARGEEAAAPPTRVSPGPRLARHPMWLDKEHEEHGSYTGAKSPAGTGAGASCDKLLFQPRHTDACQHIMAPEDPEGWGLDRTSHPRQCASRSAPHTKGWEAAGLQGVQGRASGTRPPGSEGESWARQGPRRGSARKPPL